MGLPACCSGAQSGLAGSAPIEAWRHVRPHGYASGSGDQFFTRFRYEDVRFVGLAPLADTSSLVTLRATVPSLPTVTCASTGSQ
jgi:hypothetical protein